MQGHPRRKAIEKSKRLGRQPEIGGVDVANVEILDLVLAQRPNIARIEQPDLLLAGDLEQQVRLVIDMIGRDDPGRA